MDDDDRSFEGVSDILDDMFDGTFDDNMSYE